MDIKGLNVVLLLVFLPQVQTPKPPFVPPPPPQQPLPFSHKQHLGMGLLLCKDCHVMPEPGYFATLPDTATCMICHQKILRDSPAIEQLAASHQRGEAVAWKQVYRIPDYVFFSHKEHLAQAQVTCEVCHGQVREMQQMQKVKDTSMDACMECHRQREASVECDFCHEML